MYIRILYENIVLNIILHIFYIYISCMEIRVMFRGILHASLSICFENMNGAN